MNTWKKVKSMLAEWQQQGLSKPDIVVKLANACIGWDYVFGARGEECTPANRRSYYNSKKIDTIKTACKNFDGSKSCSGCTWYPGGVTLFYDCRGFTYWCFLKGAGITIKGAGATSQYTTDANWSEKGVISNMPKDKVCCVFRYDSKTKKYEHTLIYDGNGSYIHCSGEVKKTVMSKYNATHYAIPKGLYDSSGGGGVTPVAEKAKVHADSGSTVNMREKESVNSALVARIPVGTIVDVLDHGATWSKVKYGSNTGYVMNQFLIFGTEGSGDTAKPDSSKPDSSKTVTVNKADLQKAYELLKGMLGV